MNSEYDPWCNPRFLKSNTQQLGTIQDLKLSQQEFNTSDIK